MLHALIMLISLSNAAPGVSRIRIVNPNFHANVKACIKKELTTTRRLEASAVGRIMAKCVRSNI